MGRFYTDIRKYGNTLLHRGYDEDGKQFFTKCQFQPTFYIPTKNKNSKYRYFYGDVPMEPIQYDSMQEAYEELNRFKDVNNFNVAGMEKFEYQYLVEQYPDEVPYDFDKIRILNFDIEVDSSQGFPDPQLAQETVTAITAEYNGHYFVWGYGEYTPKSDDVTYDQCEHEHALLNKFLAFWKALKPDIVTGWNSDTFDVPYMYNRISNVLGEDRAKLLSPWKVAKKRTIWIKNQENEVIDLLGIEQLDYLNLYRVFTFKKRESYKLDFISHVELGEKKLSYEDVQTLSNLYEQDYEKFIDYNIRDVELVKKLEDKLGLIKLATSLAYTTHVNYVDTMKQVRMWDSFIFYWLSKENVVVPLYREGVKEYKYEGAYVKEPIVGKHGWLVSLDYNSLYPSLIRFLNISPETLIKETISGLTVNKLLDQQVEIDSRYAVAANGTQYRHDKHSLLPRMMREIYAERKKHKKLSIDAKKLLESDDLDKETREELKRKASIHGVLDKAQKVVLNSLYGALGSNYFRYYDTSMAEAITITGQLAIRWVGKYLNEYLNDLLETDKDYVIYTDTDSVYVDVQGLVNRFVADQPKEKIVDFIDKVAEDKLESVVEQSIKDLSNYLNAAEPEALAMGREVIADSGIWQAKKRYALNVIDSEGVRYAKPKMKIMGMETAKSSTPAVVREHMEDLLYTVLNGSEADAQKLIKKIRKKFKSYAIEDIAFPRGVNNLRKYHDLVSIYTKGTPIHVRGSLLYNHYIRKMGLDKQYELIKDAEKIKFIFLREPNPIHENVIAFLQVFPRETGLDEYIDYEQMFEKSFIEPMKSIFQAIGWSMVKIKTLESMFE